MPDRLEILDTEQAQIRRQKLLLHREQRRQLDVSRMQLDLDNRLADHLELDEPEISDAERNRVVIGIGIAQCRKKVRCSGQHPSTFGTDQNCEVLHAISPPALRRAARSRRTGQNPPNRVKFPLSSRD